MALDVGTNNYYLYHPDFCDGNPCPKDCDNCPIAKQIIEFLSYFAEEGEE